MPAASMYCPGCICTPSRTTPTWRTTWSATRASTPWSISCRCCSTRSRTMPPVRHWRVSRSAAASAGGRGPAHHLARRPATAARDLLSQQPPHDAGALPALQRLHDLYEQSGARRRERPGLSFRRLLRGSGHLVSPGLDRRDRASPRAADRRIDEQGRSLQPCRPAGAAQADRRDPAQPAAALPDAAGARPGRAFHHAGYPSAGAAAARFRQRPRDRAGRAVAVDHDLPGWTPAADRPHRGRQKVPRPPFRRRAGRHVAGRRRGVHRCRAAIGSAWLPLVRQWRRRST